MCPPRVIMYLCTSLGSMICVKFQFWQFPLTFTNEVVWFWWPRVFGKKQQPHFGIGNYVLSTLKRPFSLV